VHQDVFLAAFSSLHGAGSLSLAWATELHYNGYTLTHTAESVTCTVLVVMGSISDAEHICTSQDLWMDIAEICGSDGRISALSPEGSLPWGQLATCRSHWCQASGGQIAGVQLFRDRHGDGGDYGPDLQATLSSAAK
jgi:hypothetical protein